MFSALAIDRRISPILPLFKLFSGFTFVIASRGQILLQRTCSAEHTLLYFGDPVVGLEVVDFINLGNIDDVHSAPLGSLMQRSTFGFSRKKREVPDRIVRVVGDTLERGDQNALAMQNGTNSRVELVHPSSQLFRVCDPKLLHHQASQRVIAEQKHVGLEAQNLAVATQVVLGAGAVDAANFVQSIDKYLPDLLILQILQQHVEFLAVVAACELLNGLGILGDASLRLNCRHHAVSPNQQLHERNRSIVRSTAIWAQWKLHWVVIMSDRKGDRSHISIRNFPDIIQASHHTSTSQIVLFFNTRDIPLIIADECLDFPDVMA